MPNSSGVSIRTAATVTATALGVSAAGWLSWCARTALLVLAISLLLAVALNHLVAWLEAHGLRRSLAVTAAALALFACIVGVTWLVVPPLIGQIKQFIDSWPELLSTFQRSRAYIWLQDHFDVQEALNHLQSGVPSLVGKAISIVKVVIEAVGGLVTVLFIVTFMLAAGRPLVWALLAQARPDSRDAWATLTTDVYHALGGYVLGLGAIVFTQMVATSLWLLILGVPYFLPLGVLSGLASLIPFAGALVMGTAVSVVAWGTQGIWSGLATAIYYVAYQQFENHVMTPLVYRRTVQVNSLVILVAVLIMFDLAGVAGAVLAVPIAAAGQIVLRALLRQRRERLAIPPTPPRPELLDASRADDKLGDDKLGDDKLGEDNSP